MKGKQNFHMIAGHHKITAATTMPILVSIDEAPETVINPGTSKHTLALTKPCLVSLDPSDPKKEYRFDVKSFETNLIEEPTDDRPIPNPPPPNNFLKQLRVQVRRSMGLTREDFADRQSLYEVNTMDADEVPFEEEETRQQTLAMQAEREQQEAELEEKPDEPNPEPEEPTEEK
ncbi:hypothetical protein [Microviridae sp.]|nr:hypothetical protein [Microviridae sp.]